MQVNVAPYDVRQGNFVGAGVNTVTRSGTNQFRGSLYHQFRDNESGRHGGEGPDGQPRHLQLPQHRRLGSADRSSRTRRSSSPTTRTKRSTQPGTTFRANTGGEPAAGSVTRVLQSDLDHAEHFLGLNFDYDTGPYQDYDFETPAKRFLAKGDYNLNDRNKLSVPLQPSGLEHRSCSLSNSSSLGFGNRRTSTQLR